MNGNSLLSQLLGDMAAFFDVAGTLHKVVNVEFICLATSAQLKAVQLDVAYHIPLLMVTLQYFKHGYA